MNWKLFGTVGAIAPTVTLGVGVGTAVDASGLLRNVRQAVPAQAADGGFGAACPMHGGDSMMGISVPEVRKHMREMRDDDTPCPMHGDATDELDGAGSETPN